MLYAVHMLVFIEENHEVEFFTKSVPLEAYCTEMIHCNFIKLVNNKCIVEIFSKMAKRQKPESLSPAVDSRPRGPHYTASALVL